MHRNSAIRWISVASQITIEIWAWHIGYPVAQMCGCNSCCSGLTECMPANPVHYRPVGRNSLGTLLMARRRFLPMMVLRGIRIYFFPPKYRGESLHRTFFWMSWVTTMFRVKALPTTALFSIPNARCGWNDELLKRRTRHRSHSIQLLLWNFGMAQV